MSRFFSKLDLRDIKISPQGNRFPPDEASYEERTEANVEAEAPPDVSGASQPEPAPAAVAEEAPPVHEYAEEDAYEAPSSGEVLKVSARSRPSAVAGAIAGVVRESGRAEVQAIGAGATNQAIKAVAIARDYLNETGIEANCLPSLVDLQIDEADRTAIR